AGRERSGTVVERLLQLPPQQAGGNAVIAFGGMQFTDPQPLVLYGGAPLPALYVLSVFDVRCTPMPYRAIFIGQTGNAAAKLDLDHPAVIAWGDRGGFLGLLNVSVF